MDKTHKKQGKTTAKSLGLKSILKIDTNLVVSTFGKKDNPMVVEQSINKDSGDKTIYIDKSDLKFDSSLNDNKDTLKLVSVTHNGKDININVSKNDPSENGMDYLRLKPVFEKEFFGKNYNDNIHIQIAYNLLDLKKIISLHVGNAVESLTRLQRNENDFIGTLKLDKSLDELDSKKQNDNLAYIKRLAPYYMYFDGALIRNNKKPEENTINDIDRNNYDALRALALIRQGCAHAGNHSHSLYVSEDNNKYADILKRSKQLFSDDLDKFNKDFLKNNKMNLFILFYLNNCMRDEVAQKRITNSYYNFILFKDNKNLGFNLKTIRNKIIEGCYSEREILTQLQSIRTKVNVLLDYYLYSYYTNKESLIENIVSELRESKTEEEKEEVYQREYSRLVKENCGEIEKKCRLIVDEINFAVKNKKSFKGGYIDRNQINCHSFPALIYTLCKFLDGKEVNELTTSIINKLENTKALIDAALKLQIWDGFSEGYQIFDNKTINGLIDDFRLVKNLSATKRKLKKVSGDNDKIGKKLYADAINMFKESDFVSASDEEGKGLDLYLNKFFDKKSDGGKKVRNFLLSSIIKNRRFVYLIKYIDPKNCYALVHNEQIIRFVLGQYDEKQMPLNQLQRYYGAVIENTNEGMSENSRKKMIDVLCNELMKVSIDRLLGFGDRLISKQNQRFAEHQKQLISLYLTIAYLVVKGIVHTNSIYFIAWSTFERDYYFKYNADVEKDAVDYFKLPQDYIFNKKPRVKELIEKNLNTATNNVSSKLFREYRNKIMHLNYCNYFIKYLGDIGSIKSYFDIYTYAVQKWALDVEDLFTNENYKKVLSDDLNTYKAYQRNFLKIINIPFAYNLARYKNLTIGDLFNDKYPLPKEVVKEYFDEA